MSANQCPACESELVWNKGIYQCEDCSASFKKIGFCPDCEAELEKLQACGSASHFCNHCNELKSKSRVRFEFHSAD